ncbi:MAG: GNAT family N-acetyltransferase, partial [Planctomycetota bacterium]
HGSPIIAGTSTRRFYTELAREAAKAQRLAIYTLRVDGELIAFDYCLRGQGKIDVLKESYHPEWSRYSPGNVLRYLLFRHEVERGEVSSYHLGNPSKWKMEWATRVEPLVRLRIYRRGVRGMAGYHCGPRLRATLKKSAALRGAVRWTRAAAANLSHHAHRSTAKSTNR